MQLTSALNPAELERIHESALAVLATTGVRILHSEAQERCRRAGAKVDASGVVRFPSSLMRRLTALAPSEFEIGMQDGRRVMLGGSACWASGIVTDPWIIDYESQRPRRPALADVQRNTQIVQKLDRIVAVGRMDFPVTDVAGPMSSARALFEHLLRHRKHNNVYVTDLESLALWLRIGRVLSAGRALAGSRLFTVAVASLSPLTITEMNVELLKVACAHDFPIVPTICPAAGTTSPMTLAGTLVVGHAENLAILALAQLFREGQPFLYCLGPGVTDMRTSCCMYYTLDKVLWKNAHVQLARHCGLPTVAESGGSMTYRHDMQHGAEGVLFMLSAVSAGANLLTGFGSTYNAVGHSTEMMLVQHAWLEAAEFLRQGIVVDDATLAMDEIARVGPGGNFMTEALTLQNMRGGEFFGNALFNHIGEMGDEPTMRERAHARVLELTADDTPALPKDVTDELRRVFREIDCPL
jgi:trimethylamine--corrinoid protein Co-methyltransferase